MRKEYSERLNEILDAAEKLFVQKGYENTTVNDILEDVGIGKGTFYHYFKSKEDVMDEVIKRVMEEYTEGIRGILHDPTLNAEEKFALMITGQAGSTFEDKAEFIREFDRVSNPRMLQKYIKEMVICTSPALEEVIRQGIDEGVFSTPYPREAIEIILVASNFLFDRGVFEWKPEEGLEKVRACMYYVELMLGAKPGSFNYVIKSYEEQLRGRNDE